MIDLSGKWTNRNRVDEDDVVIFHIEDLIFVYGTGVKPRVFQNFGYEKINKPKTELHVDDVFTMTWTDTFDSKGSEKGIVHECKIKIKDESTLEQVEDRVITSKKSLNMHQTTFGNWIRK